MTKNSGLNSWMAHAVKISQVYRGILATSLMFRAGIFIVCGDRSKRTNRPNGFAIQHGMSMQH